MKFLRFIPGAIALGVAGSVCVGSMYVTLTAAMENQESELIGAASDEFSVSALPTAASGAESSVSTPAEPEVVPATEAAVAVSINDVILGEHGSVSGSMGLVADVDGQLQPVAGLRIAFVRGGNIVASAVTDADGSYQASGLNPGVYAVIASGDAGFCAFGFRAVGASASSVPTVLTTAVIPPRDFDVARQLINNSLPVAPKSSSVAPQAANTDRTQPSTTIQHHQLTLDPDGSLSGKLEMMTAAGLPTSVSDLTLNFVVGNVIVASATPAADGSFTVRGLTPGSYSVIGVGPDGTLAVGIDVMGAFAVSLKPGEFLPTNVIQGGSLSAAPAGSENFNADNASEVSDGFADGQGGGEGAPAETPPAEGAPADGAAPAGAGGGGGTTGGGGGGGGGDGGGLGALLGGAAGAALGYAIGDSNDGNTVNEAASPSM